MSKKKKNTATGAIGVDIIIDEQKLVFTGNEVPIGDGKAGYMVTTKMEVNGETQEIAYGAIIPRKLPVPAEYLDRFREYSEQTTDIKKQISLSKKLYYWEGVIGTAIDILVEFATTPVRIENVKDPKCLEMLNWFKDNLNKNNKNIMAGIDYLNTLMALEWFLAGNVFPYHIWGKTDKLDGKRYNVPTDVMLLNPENIEPLDTGAMVGVPVLFMRIPDSVVEIVRKQSRNARLTAEEQIIFDHIPDDMKEHIQKSMNSVQNRHLFPLDNTLVRHIKRYAEPYAVWGKPYLVRSFAAVANKNKLKILDQSTMDGLINRVTVFKVGDPKNDKTWDPRRITALARLLSDPNPSNMLVWSYDLEVDDFGPDGKILEQTDRYDQADYDILVSLGVPIGFFIGLVKSYKSTPEPWITLMALIEKLEHLRDQIKEYWEEVLRETCEKNGFKDEDPKLRWSKMNLRNEREVRNLVLAFYDRGLISIRTALEEANYNADTQRDQREEEKKEGAEDVFSLRELPFSGKPDAGNKVSDKDDGGRPNKGNEKPPLTEVNMNNEKQAKAVSQAMYMVMNEAYKDMWQTAIGSIGDDDEIAYGILRDLHGIRDHIRTIIYNLAETNKNSRFIGMMSSEFSRLTDDILEDLQREEVTEASVNRLKDTYEQNFIDIVNKAVVYLNVKGVTVKDGR